TVQSPAWIPQRPSASPVTFNITSRARLLSSRRRCPPPETTTRTHQYEHAGRAWRYRYGLLAIRPMTPIPGSARSWSGPDGPPIPSLSASASAPVPILRLDPGPAAPVTAVKASEPETGDSTGIAPWAGSAGLAAVLPGRRPRRPNT